MGIQLPDPVVNLGAGMGLALTYGAPCRYNIGPEGRWWETVRRELSELGGVVDERIGPRPITGAEYAGTVDMPPALVDEYLWEEGFVRNPFSRLKTLDGQPECGSWVYRESSLAPRQHHVMLFEAGDARTHIYAHEEASSVNPRMGADHVDGNGQNIAKGVRWAREELPLTVEKETPDPPEAAWSVAYEREQD
ncbi:hypothetical protein SAMN05216226_11741 [Halovenus aranensis]|jgi:hypothetical protein|uniref:Uncharacterized protein n=1 Tax=Halovenus aranensis TaxID=890420 RepID=A0A1G8Z3K5_9EURY|nr:hypothetical protein [Halovenus aranensis]SDK08820.1 hypothetical protein SAMN05216226_11741 [Halovenus aranensis]